VEVDARAVLAGEVPVVVVHQTDIEPLGLYEAVLVPLVVES
jgi:hypothetical protein